MGVVALGGAAFSLQDGRDRAADLLTVVGALDAGVTMLDTARAYATEADPAHNERLMRDAIAGRQEVLISSKGRHFRCGRDRWCTDNRSARIRADCEASVETFGRPIDLYYLHRADHDLAHYSEALNELQRLREEGLVRAIGVSNIDVPQLRIAADTIHVDAVQNRHTAALLEGALVLEECERLGIPMFAYSPAQMPDGTTPSTAFPGLSRHARRLGVSVQSLLLAALLHSSPVISVVSGATRPPTVTESAAAIAIAWTPALQSAYDADRAILKRR